MFEIFGALLVLGIIFFWGSYIRKTTKNGAPFVPMEPDVLNRVMEIAEVKKGDIFYDLGSGDGRLVTAAALRGAESYGIELDTLRILYSKFWVFILRLKNAHFIQNDLFQVNISTATVVHMYLLPDTVEKLQEKLKTELKPGTRVVSVAFALPSFNPLKIDPNGTIYGPIFFYRI